VRIQAAGPAHQRLYSDSQRLRQRREKNVEPHRGNPGVGATDATLPRGGARHRRPRGSLLASATRSSGDGRGHSRGVARDRSRRVRATATLGPPTSRTTCACSDASTPSTASRAVKTRTFGRRDVSFIGMREQPDDHERHGGRKTPATTASYTNYRLNPDPEC
jgi:hypothetical protein